MFSKQKISEDRSLTVSTTTKIESNPGIPSIISSGLQIVGNLICNGGSIEIEGEIEGNVTCSNVTIRRSGLVKGDIVADKTNVDGEVNGLVKGGDIILSDSARVTGVVVYESLSVSGGAFIDGQCKSADSVRLGDVEAIEIQEGNVDNDNVIENNVEEIKKPKKTKKSNKAKKS